MTRTFISIFFSKSVNCYIYQALVRCGDPPEGVNSIRHVTGDWPGSVSLYTCVENAYFANGGKIRSLFCNFDGTWSGNNEKIACNGKSSTH